MSKFVAFRCPDLLYKSLLKDANNKSRIIIEALTILNSVSSIDNSNNSILVVAFKQYNELFQNLSEWFKSGQKTISLEQFIRLVKKASIDYNLIDKINKEL